MNVWGTTGPDVDLHLHTRDSSIWPLKLYCSAEESTWSCQAPHSSSPDRVSPALRCLQAKYPRFSECYKRASRVADVTERKCKTIPPVKASETCLTVGRNEAAHGPRKTLLARSFQPWITESLLCGESLPGRPRPPGSPPESELMAGRFHHRSIFHSHRCTHVSVTTLHLVFKCNKK